MRIIIVNKKAKTKKRPEKLTLKDFSVPQPGEPSENVNKQCKHIEIDHAFLAVAHEEFGALGLKV